jgi:hypothetical protein
MLNADCKGKEFTIKRCNNRKPAILSEPGRVRPLRASAKMASGPRPPGYRHHCLPAGLRPAVTWASSGPASTKLSEVTVTLPPLVGRLRGF